MSGRLTLHASFEDLIKVFPSIILPEHAPTIAPRFNIAPTQPIAVVANDGSNTLDHLMFGWHEPWKDDGPLINARAESIAEKPLFRNRYQQNRCVVFASGFYEWQDVPGKGKQPFYFHLKSGLPFAFAGLWKTFTVGDGGEATGAVIITTRPNPMVAKVHKRMGVMLQPDEIEQWLTPGPVEPHDLEHLLRSFPQELMAYYPVAKLVNHTANEGPELIEPVELGGQGSLF